jgi:hypothetical protein
VIYGIVEADNTSVIKIGYTATPDGRVNMRAVRMRLSGLQVSTWREIKCIAAAPGTLADEQALHAEFAQYNVRGEWFRNAAEVALWVRRNLVLEARPKRPHWRDAFHEALAAQRKP